MSGGGGWVTASRGDANEVHCGKEGGLLGTEAKAPGRLHRPPWQACEGECPALPQVLWHHLGPSPRPVLLPAWARRAFPGEAQRVPSQRDPFPLAAGAWALGTWWEEAQKKQ